MLKTLAPVRRAGIIANMEKPDAGRVVHEITSWFLARGVRVCAAPDLAGSVPAGVEILAADGMGAASDVVISIGGDGTLIAAARSLAESRTPLLGVNLGGKLGFLTEVDASAVPGALEGLLAGGVPVEERMNLDVEIRREGLPPEHIHALNDCAVNRGPVTGILEFSVHVGHEYLGTFLADGVIVSTPTGSTAYSLSAGGPILHPEMEALVVTPICPHALSLRPLVLGGDHEVEVRLLTPGNQARAAVDGADVFDLTTGDAVVISRSTRVTSLARLSSRGFYALLREKFEWGGWRSGDGSRRAP